MPNARVEDEVEGIDEEFVYHLNRGGELLGQGDAGAARASLARALELRPRDSKALGLLGQADYRLGRFADAAEAYGRLVNENPVEAAARVNLGLANLKAKRYPEAVKQLQVALDLNPAHRKAMGYLGLAHLETGDFARARDWFQRAGSEPMVARCDELMALARPPVAALAEPRPEPQPEVEYPRERREHAPTPAPLAVAPSLSSLVDARMVVPAAVEPFVTSGGMLTVAVRGEVLVRGRGLSGVRGAVRLVPEMKRFRGRATDKHFGEGADRMLRATGEGALLFRTEPRRLTAVDLAGESGYFREEVVFGFEEQLAFENGRVASRLGGDLNLVHLRGRGRLLLSLAGELFALNATADVPVRVPVAALAGWTGSLTPKVAPLFDGAEPADAGAPLCVELSGEGRVLLDPQAAPGVPSPA